MMEYCFYVSCSVFVVLKRESPTLKLRRLKSLDCQIYLTKNIAFFDVGIAFAKASGIYAKALATAYDCESPSLRSSPEATTTGESFGDCDRDGSGADIRRLSLTTGGTEPTNSPVGIEIFASALAG